MRANPFRSFKNAVFFLTVSLFLFWAFPSRAQETALSPAGDAATEWQTGGNDHYFAKTQHPAFGDTAPSSPETVNAIEPAAGEAEPAPPAPPENAPDAAPAEE